MQWTRRNGAGREQVDILAFNDVVSSETRARRYILGFCWKNHQRFCPKCRERKLYPVDGGDRRRCARCGYTFHDFSRRFLNGCAFDARRWLWFLKLFELGVAPANMAAQLGVAYATVLKAQDIARRAVLAQALDAPALYRAGIWPGPGAPRPKESAADSPVFGIIDLNGMVVCDVLSEITPNTLLSFKFNFGLRTAALGRVVYTAPYRQYRALLCCGESLWPSRLVRHDDRKLAAEAAGFWGFARQRLARLRGVTPAQFPLHLKELELRYNQREGGLSELLIRAVCGFVPDG